MLRRLTSDLLELIYPPRCIVCKTNVDAGDQFCLSCGEHLAALEDRPACGRCAAPLATDDAPCVRCKDAGIRPFDRVVALGVFDGPLRRLVHHFKYHGGWSAGEILAGRLTRHAPARELLARADVVVPVPLHVTRQWKRGFNQADVIAQSVARPFGLRLVRPAIRKRRTATQTHQTSRRARALNLRDAFLLVRPRTIVGKHVLLIDDVMTSAATLRSLARVLRPARPASMSVIVIAVADPKGHTFELL